MTAIVQNHNETKALDAKGLFSKNDVKKRFDELLGAKSQGFITSVLQAVQSNALLQKADPNTVLAAAATAAALDLPINQSLGKAYIVPYKGQAQFQIGWKGLVELALRAGVYESINSLTVYENQYKSWNAMTEELDADFETDGEGKVVGYVAYFKLNKEAGGFRKVLYWSKDKVKKHAQKYSQTYGKKNRQGNLIHSPWNDPDQFDSMAKKTVLKQALSTYGVLSVEMQRAVISDQAVMKKEGEYSYPDNETINASHEEVSEEKEKERISRYIQDAKDMDALVMVYESCEAEIMGDEGLTLEYQEKILDLKESGS